jgi:hypothetical protein
VTERPSIHNPITKSYAIDQITDIEYLRTVAHRMWEAFSASHQQTAHVFAVLMGYDGACPQCMERIEGISEDACEKWQEWQRKVSDGFGSV